jgi:hypothetical protein
MSRFTRIETGTFKIDSIDVGYYGRAPQVVLVKNDEKFPVKLRRIGNKIIGKTELELTLYLTKKGSWVVGPARNKITVKVCKGCGKEVKRWSCCGGYYNFTWVSRNKRVVEDIFTAVYQDNPTKRRSSITLEDSKGEEFKCHLHDIFRELPKVYTGIPIKLREKSKGVVHVWVPIE